MDKRKIGDCNIYDRNMPIIFLITSCTTWIDINLISSLCIILETTSSGSEIDFQKLKKYINNTATLYVDIYGCYHT